MFPLCLKLISFRTAPSLVAKTSMSNMPLKPSLESSPITFSRSFSISGAASEHPMATLPAFLGNVSSFRSVMCDSFPSDRKMQPEATAS